VGRGAHDLSEHYERVVFEHDAITLREQIGRIVERARWLLRHSLRRQPLLLPPTGRHHSGRAWDARRGAPHGGRAAGAGRTDRPYRHPGEAGRFLGIPYDELLNGLAWTPSIRTEGRLKVEPMARTGES